MPSKFALPKVSHVVWREILSQLELIEIFSLSLCSQKTFNIIQQNVPKKSITNPLHLDTVDRYNPNVGFIVDKEYLPLVYCKPLSSKLNDDRSVECVEFGGEHKTRLIKRHDYFVTFFENKYDGLKFVVKHICSLFRIVIHTVRTSGPWPLRIVRSLQTTPLHMTYVTDDIPFHSNYEFIAAADITRGFRFGGSALHFSALDVSYEVALFEYIHLSESCFSLPEFVCVASRSKEVFFNSCSSVQIDLRGFYRSWINGRFNNSEFVSIKLENYDARSSLQNYRHRIVHVEKEVTYKSFTGDVYNLFPGIGIRRDDGAIASIHYDTNTERLNFGVVAGLTEWRRYDGDI